MKLIHSSIIRSLTAIITGILLIKYRDQLLNWLLVTVGVMFFVSGAISLCFYYVARRKVQKAENAEENKANSNTPLSFPIVGLGSILLGIILICMPATFVRYLIYFFAALLILGAISQFINLAQMIRLRPLHWAFWILPTILLIVGCISVIDPNCIANLLSSFPAIIIGSFLVVYGLAEIINSIQISRLRKKASLGISPINKEDIEDAEIIEETPPTKAEEASEQATEHKHPAK